ncbi:MAG: hypothetical protein HRT68_08005 [Flavobacteriaceae bacterium]|nr:hypothetical protein [Flavobacteriaceae bacterium]
MIGYIKPNFASQEIYITEIDFPWVLSIVSDGFKAPKEVIKIFNAVIISQIGQYLEEQNRLIGTVMQILEPK